MRSLLHVVVAAAAVGCGDSGGVSSSSGSADGSSSTSLPTDATGPTTVTMTGATTESGPTSSVGSTTDAGSTTDDSCQGDDDCTEPAARFCENQVCVPCSATEDGNARCASLDQGTPACVGDRCVECSAEIDEECFGSTPTCDAQINTCVGCTYHFHCPESACDIEEGRCFDEAMVVTLFDVDSIQDNVADGVTIRLALGFYREVVTIDSGDAVAIMAQGLADPEWDDDSNGAPHLTVEGGARVYLQGLSLRGNAFAEGIAVDNAIVYADETEVVQNTGGGITAVNDAKLVLRNCFVGRAGFDYIAVDVVSSDALILYSTLFSGYLASAALSCSFPGTVEVRNSILVVPDGDDPAPCFGGGVTFVNSSVQNLASLNWFTDFDAGDVHLTLAGNTEFMDIAVWEDGDPPIDIDGQDRVTVDGTMDHAGADVP